MSVKRFGPLKIERGSGKGFMISNPNGSVMPVKSIHVLPDPRSMKKLFVDVEYADDDAKETQTSESGLP